MKERYIKWYTRHLSRDFHMLVVGYSGFPVVLFPGFKGRYYQYKDSGLIDAAAGLIESGRLKLYCPDGIDEMSWHNYAIHPADRVKTHLAYENVIVKEVMEFAMRETGSKRIGAAGCEFGAYHAANLAFRHPNKVGYLVTLSGTFNIKPYIYGYYDDNCYYNNPPDYLPGLVDPWYLDRIRSMGIILGAGDNDPRLEENKRLSAVLSAKGIDHRLDILPDAGPDSLWWNDAFVQYVSQIHEVRYR